MFSLYSCHPIFCEWDSGYEQLTEFTDEDVIIGNYKLTKNSIDFLKTEGYSELCELKLLDYGVFELTKAPDFMFDSFGRNNGMTTDKTGKWRTTCDKPNDCMIELFGITVVPLAKRGNGPISILITIGDGDECNGIIFEKTDN